MNSETMQYASYLVRLWREETAVELVTVVEPATAVDPAARYRAEVEHIQTGQRRQFHTPDDLWAFLNRTAPTGEYDGTLNE